jgi:D-alanyl-D-alanine carboxypeptidase/D-alanyl-D-alanine-endopeptidase (penicillin-binding protein 4)
LSTSLDALTTILTQLGVAPDGYALADGSGLSRHNRISPEAIVQTLQGMTRSRNAEAYRNSLPVAGVSGTLKNRFRDTPVEINLQAKTGSLADTIALSGYLKPSNYSALTISIVVNQFNQPLGQVQRGMDEIVEHLAQLRTCRDEG